MFSAISTLKQYFNIMIQTRGSNWTLHHCMESPISTRKQHNTQTYGLLGLFIGHYEHLSLIGYYIISIMLLLMNNTLITMLKICVIYVCCRVFSVYGCCCGAAWCGAHNVCMCRLPQTISQPFIIRKSVACR